MSGKEELRGGMFFMKGGHIEESQIFESFCTDIEMVLRKYARNPTEGIGLLELYKQRLIKGIGVDVGVGL